MKAKLFELINEDKVGRLTFPVQSILGNVELTIISYAFP